jgi:hypothetical protein
MASTALATKPGPRPKFASLAEHIEALSVGEPLTGCWLWLGSVNRKGYGQLTHEQRHYAAHRASFAAFKGDPTGRLVCHDCDQPGCVNPSHLYAGTHVDNRADMLARARWTHPWAARTHCAAGHEYAVVGYSVATDGSRTCKECQRQNKRNQRSKK